MNHRHRTTLVVAAAAVALVATLPSLRASEDIDYDGINKIKQQGLSPQNSQVMEVMSYLTDVYGPRLTGSPNAQKAGEWAVAKMKEWGLQNVALEPWTACPPPAPGAAPAPAPPEAPEAAAKALPAPPAVSAGRWISHQASAARPISTAIAITAPSPRPRADSGGRGGGGGRASVGEGSMRAVCGGGREG